MLETEIKALREEIIMLREAITAMGENFIQKPKEKKAAPAPAPAQTAAPAAPPPVPAPAPTPEAPAPAAPAPATVTRDDLQNLCMTIVRADRSKREAVQQVISKYGAANLVAVKDTDLVALHADLEALK